jgi:hypothetical protein
MGKGVIFGGTEGKILFITLLITPFQLRQTSSDKMIAVVGGMVDAEAMVSLKDLFNRFNSENVYAEEYFPIQGSG